VNTLCCICGKRAGSRRLKVSEKFVSFPELFSGSLICDLCSTLLDGNFRRSSWVFTGDGVRQVPRGELLEALRNPPVGGFVYVKSGGRKYGYLRCLRYGSSSALAVLCGEDEGPVFVGRNRLAELVEQAVEAYRVLGRKQPLLEGCSATDWVHEDVCRLVESVRGDPAWKIVVRAL